MTSMKPASHETSNAETSTQEGVTTSNAIHSTQSQKRMKRKRPSAAASSSSSSETEDDEYAARRQRNRSSQRKLDEEANAGLDAPTKNLSSPSTKPVHATDDKILLATGARPFRGKCLYQSRKCENERALKRNGQAHNLCEEHRSKQNQHQRKFDAKKFTRRRRDQRSDDGKESRERAESPVHEDPTYMHASCEKVVWSTQQLGDADSRPMPLAQFPSADFTPSPRVARPHPELETLYYERQQRAAWRDGQINSRPLSAHRPPPLRLHGLSDSHPSQDLSYLRSSPRVSFPQQHPTARYTNSELLAASILVPQEGQSEATVLTPNTVRSPEARMAFPVDGYYTQDRASYVLHPSNQRLYNQSLMFRSGVTRISPVGASTTSALAGFLPSGHPTYQQSTTRSSPSHSQPITKILPPIRMRSASLSTSASLIPSAQLPINSTAMVISPSAGHTIPTLLPLRPPQTAETPSRPRAQSHPPSEYRNNKSHFPPS